MNTFYLHVLVEIVLVFLIKLGRFLLIVYTDYTLFITIMITLSSQINYEINHCSKTFGDKSCVLSHSWYKNIHLILCSPYGLIFVLAFNNIPKTE